MTTVATINEEIITADDFVKLLKINNLFQDLLKEIISDKLTTQISKKQGTVVTPQEVQERADQFRRVRGLHRAKDTQQYLDAIGFTLDDFENHLADTLYKEKMVERITSDAAVEEFFKLNSPKFESVKLSHIVLDSEGKAKEVVACLQDDPDGFVAMAREHSLSASTRESGGLIGKVRRGMLPEDIEAKVFGAAAGEVLGPFPTKEGGLFEIFKVEAREPAQLNDATRAEVRKLLYRQWLAKQVGEHKIAVS